MRSLRAGSVTRFWKTVVCLVGFAACAACGAFGPAPKPTRPDRLQLPGQPSGVFSPAHTTVRSAVADFFWIQPEPTQPIEFPHYSHIEQGLACTDCHQGVESGPIAGFPSVNTCMACHSSVATDRPMIQTITKLQEQGRDIPWQRVNRYTNQQHVRFNHAPHIKAKVECATCHGNVANQTVAKRNVDLTMGFCVTCHREKGASNECLTCHF